jgi:hypothetical protein
MMRTNTLGGSSQIKDLLHLSLVSPLGYPTAPESYCNACSQVSNNPLVIELLPLLP